MKTTQSSDGIKPIAKGSNAEAAQKDFKRYAALVVAERRNKHLKFVKQFSFHISTTFMDYLHGDVNEEEAQDACRYEYARESKLLCEAAKEPDSLKARATLDWQQAALAVVGRHPQHWFARASWAATVLGCPSFPNKDWNELRPEERKQLMRFSRTEKIPPLPMTDVYTLKVTGVLDKFREMAGEAEPIIEAVRPGQVGKPMRLVAPVLQKWESVFYALFDVDYSKGETQLVKEFKAWLRLSENLERLDTYEKPKTGTTGGPLDRLKNLAAWRLYRELDNDWDAANKFANDHRKHFKDWQEIREKCTPEQRKQYKPGDPRPFRDAKQKEEKQATGELVVIPPNQASLFGEDSDARKAQGSAWSFLTQIMPEEFRPLPHGLMLDMFVKLAKLASNR